METGTTHFYPVAIRSAHVTYAQALRDWIHTRSTGNRPNAQSEVKWIHWDIHRKRQGGMTPELTRIHESQVERK